MTALSDDQLRAEEHRGFEDASDFLLREMHGLPKEERYAPPEDTSFDHRDTVDGSNHDPENCLRCRYNRGWIEGLSK